MVPAQICELPIGKEIRDRHRTGFNRNADVIYSLEVFNLAWNLCCGTVNPSLLGNFLAFGSYRVDCFRQQILTVYPQESPSESLRRRFCTAFTVASGK